MSRGPLAPAITMVYVIGFDYTKVLWVRGQWAILEINTLLPLMVARPEQYGYLGYRSGEGGGGRGFVYTAA